MNPVLFEFFSLLILGSVFMFVFVTFFVNKLQCPLENRYLSILVFVFGFRMLFDQFSLEPWYSHYDYNIWQALNFAFVPLTYLYIRSLLSGYGQKTKNGYLHYIPAVLSFFILLPYLINRLTSDLTVLNDSRLLKLEWLVNIAVPVANYIQVFVYYGIISMLIKQYNLNNGKSDDEAFKIRYKYVVLISVSTFLAYVFNGIRFFTIGSVISHVASLSFVMMMFVITLITFYFFLNHPGIINYNSGSPDRTEGTRRTKKYLKTRMPEKDVDRIMSRVEEVMKEDDLFEDMDISLNRVAEKVGCEPYMLSQVINRKTNGNFYNYINGYRIAYSKKLLKDPDCRTMTVLEIAYRSGFSSKSSFNEVFKKHTNMTPSEYRKKLASIC
ncbi:MAG: helix-turn-helix transcriptional regulator [Spirochaetes bacterium]|jgi:AraC-like DNA-binding protein|nr:helix-turn-helix transcriptional regulator [Spirochaetota bacterium]